MRIRTRSRSTNGFRRAGVRHTAEAQTWPAGTFTEEQVEALRSDPELFVEILPDEPEVESSAAAEGTPEGGAKPAAGGKRK